MKTRPALAIILCGALTIGAQAMPINYLQISDAQVAQQTSRSASSQTQSSTSTQGSVNTATTMESQDQPEFVRLSDGRLIPYGPGIICSDLCVEPVAAENPPGLSRRWLIAIPIAGAAIAAVLLASGDSSLPRPTAVSNDNQGPTPTPTPNPNPTPTPTPTNPGDQPQPVPEPGTIALLGIGLALFSRKKVLGMLNRNQK